MHKSLNIFGVVFVLVCFLQAEIQVTGTVVTGTIINGYFNRSNSYIQIEIRLTGADAIGDHSNDHVNLRYGSSTSASITIGTDAEDEFTNSADPKLSNNPEFFENDGSDRVLYYKFYVPDLTHINAAPEGKYFEYGQLSISILSGTFIASKYLLYTFSIIIIHKEINHLYLIVLLDQL